MIIPKADMYNEKNNGLVSFVIGNSNTETKNFKNGQCSYWYMGNA